MDRSTQVAYAQRLRALHDRRHPLLLPNAWDAGSAALFASLGFPAVATTSGGVAWSLGYADGEQAPLAEVLAAIARITRATPAPVTADFEAGFGDTPAAVASHVRAAIDAGVAGLNLEDGIRHETLRPIDEAAARIHAAREAAWHAGVPVFVNARVDTFIAPWPGSEAARVEETVRRAEAYLAAGADGIYPIGASEPALLRTLAARIPAPINIAARDGLPDLAELAALGIARVSTATRLASLAYAGARAAALRLKDSGHFDGLDAGFGYADMQRLFPHP